MKPALRNLVRRRARFRCEYCGVHQHADPLLTFHVEHIIARQHGGLTDEANLCLSCHHCNLHKGTNLSGIDPLTGKLVRLFHPREQAWVEHFRNHGAIIVGRTPIGRVTANLLAMNASARVALRAISANQGRRT